jgi:UDP-3-O-acyl N-acetylglucosamine deacetylase
LDGFLRRQRTIGKTTSVTGFGLWSGSDVRVEFRPAPPGSGLVFVRSDLDSKTRIPATVDHRIEMPLRTTLAVGDISVEMVEHIIAACAGLQVDNCEIWVDQIEMPGMDGSSLAFVEALDDAGFVTQSASRPQLKVNEPIRVGTDAEWVELSPTEHAGLSCEYHLDYGTGPIGRQTYGLQVSPDAFRKELAASRTFLLQHEAERLRSSGLGSRVTYQDLLVFDETAPIDNELRFLDECARHKTLDLIGDLALAGCDLVGHVVAHCSGHRLNAELVTALLEREQRNQDCRKIA